jgi:eukaryotic-like serine/threonine-protein kinase
MPASRLTVSGEERTRLAKARLGQRVLGKWRLDQLIGLGGMAAVFEATHKNGNRVAIKILHSDLASFEEIRERFLSEGYAANRVAHPGVVTVRDEGTTEDGAVFLVMDLLRGQTLAQRLAPGGAPLSVGQVLEITAQLLDVLVQAHQRGIVHRDIKPENIFLTREGRVRLLDFGIARVAAAQPSHQTQAGKTLGTPSFMPPEQALGRCEALDGRSDLWSLGATMFLLLSGIPVRERGGANESLGEVTDLPRSVVALVDRALAFDRADRFPDASAMKLAVRAVQSELSPPDSRATLPPPSVEPMALSLRTPRPHRRRRRPSVQTVRPVSSTMPPPSATRAPPARSALPLYVTFGFALGISIVVAARLSLRPHEHATLAEPEPVSSLAHAALPSAPLPPSSSALPAVSASSSTHVKASRPRQQPSDPFSRRR